MPRKPPPPPSANRPSQPAPAGLVLDPDEPAFVIRASDFLGPEILLRWADLAEEFNVPRERIEAARKCAAAMERWRHERGLVR